MSLKTAIIGVGPVGDRICSCLKERNFPVEGKPVVMATRARTETLGGEEVAVQEVSAELFDGVKVAFFAGREGAKGASVIWKEAAEQAGAVCIDNGSDFRLYPDIPLVVPEVNMDDVTPDTRFIASPNCSTIQMVVALAPLHRAARIRRIVVTTFQSVSGWGAAAQDELKAQLPCLVKGDKVCCDPGIFPRPIALDCLPHIDSFLDNGYTKEEMKMLHETRKILGDPDIAVVPTAVRVPVEIGHSEAINVEFEGPMDARRAMEILSDPTQSEGVVLIDGPTQDPERLAYLASKKGKERKPWAMHWEVTERQYPTQADVLEDAWKDKTLVGRVRDDNSRRNCINLWCVADNLRKGAATNVVQIAEKMIERGLL
ncbi:aspartate-semialdehyde dehydrogenase [bacterium]|nr:aspartate-semialdehyde dehydrogenase [bacterium]